MSFQSMMIVRQSDESVTVTLKHVVASPLHRIHPEWAKEMLQPTIPTQEARAASSQGIS